MSRSGGARRGKGGAKRGARPSPLFDELLFAPDRDQVPGARAVLSYDDGDDGEFLDAVEACATNRVRLQRRGLFHGDWAELDLRTSGIDPVALARDQVCLDDRWRAARPFVLPRSLEPFDEDELGRVMALREQLEGPEGLGEFLRSSGLGGVEGLELFDERDVAKCRLVEAQGVWLKSARLSGHPEDASLRLRVSFGEEVEDDAARDDELHGVVSEAAEALLPGAREIGACQVLRDQARGAIGAPVLFTQHIAYWNAPGGGALFHHDAFDEEARGGQRGVLYVQLVGSTAWLALSLEDLARRVTEFAEALEQGEAEWVRKSLWPDRRDFERVLARVRDPRALLRELALPGCGRLGPLVNQGPDFTSYLADAGHGFLVHAGDALFLPNHGLASTAMHSVFCASDSSTYALSLALREA